MADQVSRSATSRRARREVKALIRFYERRGWCWLGAVAYTAWRAM